MDKIEKTDAEWQKELTPEQFQICRECGTEPPFSGKYLNCHDEGIYRCVCCGNELFDSATKFDSGTGWPSFWQAYKPENIVSYVDTSRGMKRMEVRCKQCNAHLGHVFPDGPKPTRQRYCINSASLKLERK